MLWFAEERAMVQRDNIAKLVIRTAAGLILVLGSVAAGRWRWLLSLSRP
jgi:hypothetical protein